MSREVVERHYRPEPTLQKFHASRAFVRGVLGPIGSGKSVGCCIEILKRSRAQAPDAMGIRKSRWSIIRNTFGELKSTTIKTWQQWVPDSACPIVYDSPIRGTMVTRLPDKTIVMLEVLFFALDRDDDVKKLLSLELSGAYINEAREIPKSILDGVTGRVDRYPSKADGGCSWSGVIMDTNPPDDSHWWYKVAEEETPRGWEFFHQPPAILYDEKMRCWVPNPAAENIKNLNSGYDYYLKQTAGKTREWINVYCCGQYGSTQAGKPVYPEYNDDIHSADDIDPLTSLELMIGFDFGRTPACVIGQVTPRGKLIGLDELTSEDMGLEQFLRDVVGPFLAVRYSDWELEEMEVAYDPAGDSKGQTDDRSCADLLRAFGFKRAQAAKTNAFLPRRSAVASYLIRLVDGKPACVISRRMKTVRRGFLGGYRYRKMQACGETRYADEPEKNAFSHPADAWQYLALRASAGVSSREQRKSDDEKKALMLASLPIAGGM